MLLFDDALRSRGVLRSVDLSLAKGGQHMSTHSDGQCALKLKNMNYTLERCASTSPYLNSKTCRFTITIKILLLQLDASHGTARRHSSASRPRRKLINYCHICHLIEFESSYYPSLSYEVG